MSKQLFENLKNTPANMLAFLIVAIAPTRSIDYSIFQGELLADEKILWAGQPETKFILKGGDVVLSIFGLVWTGFFSLFFLGDFITSGDIFEISISIVFMLVGLYFLFGRFIIGNYEKKRTFYAVTNQRVLIITNMHKKNVQAKLIDQIPVLIKTVHKDDIGTIQFDNLQYNMNGESVEYIYPPTFQDIKNVNTIYKLINDLKRPREIA